MEYKVGDKVKIKSLDWYNTNKDDFGLIFCNNICFDEKMIEFCGKTVTIAAQRDNKYYYISEDNCLSFWSEDMIECLVERHGKTYPYKIGDRVILKGNNRCATITDLKYNSWGNLSYYIKIDNDKDISVDYPTDLLLPCDNDKKVEDIVDEPQDKMVSLNKVCEQLKNTIDEDVLVKRGSVIDCMDIDDFVLYFRKIMEE